MSLVNQNIITLKFYDPTYKSLLEDYNLPLEQQQYTSLPLDALQKCDVDIDRHPVMILYNNIPAGFFVLHSGEGVKAYSNNTKAILLRAYSINTDFQGKGIAITSIKLLPEFVRLNFPKINEIILAVNYMNKIAQHVYIKAGFIDSGIRTIGKKGELLILNIDLDLIY